MNLENEFRTVELVMSSGAETSGVDAFALALIKAERQMRKLFTFLVYQFPCFQPLHIAELRAALGKYRGIYFNDFITGIDALSNVKVEKLIGQCYGQLYARLAEATAYRNKIFHGQLTDKRLSHSDLVGIVNDMKMWCALLADSALQEFGYDGFARPSFQKSTIPELWNSYRVCFTCIGDYAAFLANNMTREKRKL